MRRRALWALLLGGLLVPPGGIPRVGAATDPGALIAKLEARLERTQAQLSLLETAREDVQWALAAAAAADVPALEQRHEMLVRQIQGHVRQVDRLHAKLQELREESGIIAPAKPQRRAARAKPSIKDEEDELGEEEEFATAVSGGGGGGGGAGSARAGAGGGMGGGSEGASNSASSSRKAAATSGTSGGSSGASTAAGSPAGSGGSGSASSTTAAGSSSGSSGSTAPSGSLSGGTIIGTAAPAPSNTLASEGCSWPGAPQCAFW